MTDEKIKEYFDKFENRIKNEPAKEYQFKFTPSQWDEIKKVNEYNLNYTNSLNSSAK